MITKTVEEREEMNARDRVRRRTNEIAILLACAPVGGALVNVKAFESCPLPDVATDWARAIRAHAWALAEAEERGR